MPCCTTGAGYWREGVGTLRGREQDSHENLAVTFDRQSSGEYGQQEIASTVSARDFKSATDLVITPIAIQDVRGMDKAQNGREYKTDGSAYTVDAMATQGVAFAENSRGEVRFEGGDGQRCGALSAGGGKAGQGVPCVAFADTAQTITAGMYYDYNDEKKAASHLLGHGTRVRRLTPIECEALQALPRNWTLIPWRGKPSGECPDGPRYKGIGNGQTVSVMQWLARRIFAGTKGAENV